MFAFRESKAISAMPCSPSGRKTEGLRPKQVENTIERDLARKSHQLSQHAKFSPMVPPFAPLIYNVVTIEAMKQARRGNLKRFGSVQELLDDLYANG